MFVAQFVLLFLGLKGRLIYLFSALAILNGGLILYVYLRRLFREPLAGIVYLQLLLEGALQVWPLYGGHILHYPAIVGGALVIQGWQFLVFLAVQPLMHLRELISVNQESMVFLFTSMVVGPGVYLFVRGLRQKERHYRQAYQRLMDSAEAVSTSHGLDRDTLVKRYLSERETLKADLREMARTISFALLADRTTIFTFEGGRLTPVATDEDAPPEIKPSGILYEVVEQKRPRVLHLENSRLKPKAGFDALEGVMSILYCPIMDENVLVGVLVAESLRYRAFEERESKLAETLSVQVSQLIKKHRLLSIMSLEHELLQTLQRESERLIQKLGIEEVTEAIKEGAMAITAAEGVFVMLRDGRSYVLMGDETEKKRFTLKGTLVEDIAINKQPFYFRDTKHFRKEPLPFPSEDRPRCLAGFPLLSGKNITGMVVITSSEADAFTEKHLGIMQLYCNQASESISRALLHEDIKMKALTDGLTGLFNHRHFQERLEENIKRAERFREKLSLMLLDIDHFKRINDTYGHPVGDQVLKTLASVIDDTVREIDIPARYGGEEFAVLLIGADKKAAQQIAERLRQRVKKLRFPSQTGEFSITVSIGIATFPEDATTRETLIERADEALYQAKNSGRDRVVLRAAAS